MRDRAPTNREPTDRHAEARQTLLFQEVDDELRQDRLKSLWKQYGSTVIGAAVALVLGVAGAEGYKAYQTQQRLDDAVAYEALAAEMDQGALPAAAMQSFAEGAATGHGVLAMLDLAGAQVEGAELREAAATLASLREAAAARDPLLEAHVAVQEAALRFDLAAQDPAEADTARSLLARYNDNVHPYRHISMLLLAAAALDEGRTDEARALTQALTADPTTPNGIRAQATQIAGFLPPETATAPTTVDE